VVGVVGLALRLPSPPLEVPSLVPVTQRASARVASVASSAFVATPQSPSGLRVVVAGGA
jgi:hypothetical protein